MKVAWTNRKVIKFYASNNICCRFFQTWMNVLHSSHKHFIGTWPHSSRNSTEFTSRGFLAYIFTLMYPERKCFCWPALFFCSVNQVGVKSLDGLVVQCHTSSFHHSPPSLHHNWGLPHLNSSSNSCSVVHKQSCCHG